MELTGFPRVNAVDEATAWTCALADLTACRVGLASCPQATWIICRSVRMEVDGIDAFSIVYISRSEMLFRNFSGYS